MTGPSSGNLRGRKKLSRTHQISSERVGFLPGQASLAYFFLRGSLRVSGRYGAVTGVGLREIGG